MRLIQNEGHVFFCGALEYTEHELLSTFNHVPYFFCVLIVKVFGSRLLPMVENTKQNEPE